MCLFLLNFYPFKTKISPEGTHGYPQMLPINFSNDRNIDLSKSKVFVENKINVYILNFLFRRNKKKVMKKEKLLVKVFLFIHNVPSLLKTNPIIVLLIETPVWLDHC